MIDSYNAYTKIYSNGLKVQLSSSHVIKYDGDYVDTRRKGVRGSLNNERCRTSTSRSLRSFFDIAFNNDWTIFCTLTFNPVLVDSFDPHDVLRSFKTWADVHCTRKGFNWLFVSECHKSGRIHFHGLCDIPVSDLVYSGHDTITKSGSVTKIYNLPTWKYGFSTAIPLYGEIDHTVYYCLKYISKDCNPIFNHFYFAGGHSLSRKPIKGYHNVEFEDEFGRVFCSPHNPKIKFKYKIYK